MSGRELDSRPAVPARTPESDLRHAVEDAIATYRQHADSDYAIAVVVLVEIAGDLVARWDAAS